MDVLAEDLMGATLMSFIMTSLFNIYVDMICMRSTCITFHLLKYVPNYILSIYSSKLETLEANQDNLRIILPMPRISPFRLFLYCMLLHDRIVYNLK